jgi:hypothetical protein
LLAFVENNWEVNILVSWGRAFRAAGAYVGWSILWALVGIAIAATGYAMIIGGVTYSFFGGVSYAWGGLIGGIILVIIGYIITVLGLMAAFFKILPEVVAEELHRQNLTFVAPPQMSTPQPATPDQVTSCPTCGGPLRYIQQYQRWYCDRERKYV